MRLNQNGFSFAAPWHNEDADEQTFALLTPRLSGGSADAFEYTDASGVHVLTYVGTPVDSRRQPGQRALQGRSQRRRRVQR